MSTPRILFVDDEEKVLKSLIRHFLDEDYELLTATSGRQALEILDETAVEVVVSDFRMPEMNGGELLREVSNRWPETVRMVLSGYADISAVISAINDGAIFKFISKPWHDNELKDAVREAIERYHASAEMRRLAEQALAVHQNLISDEQQQTQASLDRGYCMESRFAPLQRIENAFRSAGAPILIFDGAGELVEINPAGARIFLRTSEIADSEPTMALPPQLADDVRLVLETGEILMKNYETGACHRTPCRVSLAPLCQSASERGVVVMFLPL